MFSWRTGATASLLALTLFAVYVSGKREPEELSQPLSTLPEEIGGWASVKDGKLDEQTEAVLSASDYLYRVYRKDGKQVDMFMAFYAMQRAGEAMHSPKNCLPGSGWEIWNYDTVELPVEGETVEVNKYWIQRGRDRMLVLYWYQNGERVIASEYSAKAYLVWDALRTGRTSGSIVRVTVADSPDAEEAGRKFAADLIPLVRNVLPRS
jgi:EpsI family protein